MLGIEEQASPSLQWSFRCWRTAHRGQGLAEHNWPEAKKFDPERFNKATQKERPGFKYLPFGGGPRLCIGNSFAIMEMQLVITRILQSFDFELVKNQTIEMEPLVTLRPRYGIKLKVQSKI